MVVSVKAKSTRKMRLDRMAICFERLAANQPEPKTELNFSSPYTLLGVICCCLDPGANGCAWR